MKFYFFLSCVKPPQIDSPLPSRGCAESSLEWKKGLSPSVQEKPCLCGVLAVLFPSGKPNEKVCWHSRVAQGVTASHRPGGVLLATVGLCATEKQFPKNYDEKNMSPTLTNPCCWGEGQRSGIRTVMNSGAWAVMSLLEILLFTFIN